ncbi:30S ribosomal protein S9 [Patescibacteria group bacterium]|nr:30S ribosomal protein S9 [Patescibacteria group bacterium]MBU4600491.1 30S ribosomal protein S9 [Patescibacteria group bacterium]MCG2697525.1 30S ribosomal protein S9 [Candidatus Parcubacteria bacterium]
MADDNKKIQKVKNTEELKFTGKYISALGKRKTSTARVRLYKNGKGIIAVNGKAMNDYFNEAALRTVAAQPLKLTGHLKDFDFSILAKGGGTKSQADAVRHGITRALEKFDEKLRPVLKAKGWLTRDSRKKERKKPGLKKARRAPQWSKR